MNPATNGSRKTVLVAADVSGFSGSTLGLAVRMAAALKARLHGLFVEDEDLLLVTGLPISCEIGLATARERPTDVARMQRALQSLSRQFESSLEREARACSVGYSFEYVRGRIRDIGLCAPADAGFTILERKRPAPRHRSPVAFTRVLWVTRDPEYELPVLRAVLDYPGRRKPELVLVGDVPEASLAKCMSALQSEHGGDIALQHWSESQLLERLAHRAEFEFAVLSRPAASDMLTAILGSIGCPVILVT